MLGALVSLRASWKHWFLAAVLATLGIMGASIASGETVVQVTQISYDAAGRPECTAVRMNPDAYGSLPTGPNAACDLGVQGIYGPDRITKTVYDAAGQVVQVRQAVKTSIERVYSTFAYSPNGKVTDSIDANGNRTKMSYDGFDRLSALNYPSTTRPSGWNPSSQANALATAGAASTTDFETYAYDPNSNRTTWRRRDGRVIYYNYDNLNREVLNYSPAIGNDPSPPIRPTYTTYDLTGKVVKKRFDGVDGQGVTYSYDGLGRLLSTTDMNNKPLSYTYNQASARTGMVFPDGKTQSYSYDTLNRLIYTDVSGSGVATNWAYNNRGLIEGRGRWNNTSSAFYYDGIGRLTGMHHAFPDSTRNVQWGFTYNPASQITNLTAGNTAQYDYRETQTATDNRTYDGLNRDTGIAALTNGYDARGNMTNDGSRQMTYDLYNRMLTLTGNGQNLQMTYDPEGRLASYTVNGATTTFLYDGVKLIAEYNGAGQMQKRYLHGIGTDDPWVEVSGSDVTSSNTSYLYANYQGSIFALANGSGALTDVYKYGPYGEPKNALNQTSFAGSRFRYTGQTVLPEAQLYYYKARVYDPIQGRFLQTDPIGNDDDLNLYGYVGGDPINSTDPTGNESAQVTLESMKIIQQAYDELPAAERKKRAQAGLIATAVVYGGAACVAGGCQAAARSIGSVYAGWRFAIRLNKVRKILEGWAETPNRKGQGSRFQDPNDKGNRVRVDRGNPEHELRTQQKDHVVEQKGGKTVDSDGKPIEKQKPSKTEEAHQPLTDWIKRNKGS